MATSPPAESRTTWFGQNVLAYFQGRQMVIDAKTGICAVIGDPIEHSLSPAIHNAAFAEKRLNLAYLAFQVKDVGEAMAGVRGLGLRGLSVTIPHKVAVMGYLDTLDPLAKNIGAVNTIVAGPDGHLTGHNTDGIGATKALEAAGVCLEKAAVLLIGSGGAARAIAFTLTTQAPIRELTIVGIEEEQLKELVSELRVRSKVRVQGLLATADTYARTIPGCQILINASPMGMSPRTEETPVPEKLLYPDLVVFDIVYNPLRTRLLKEAEKKGCQTVPGVEMFVQQAAAQFELWTGEEAPVAVMREVVLDALRCHG